MADSNETNAANDAAPEGSSKKGPSLPIPTSFLSWLRHSVAKKGEELFEEARGEAEDFAALTLGILKVSIVLPIILLVLGVIVGYVGEQSGTPAAVVLAKYLCLFCGLIAALGLTAFRLLVGAGALAALGATNAGNAVWKSVPVLSPANIEAFMGWLVSGVVWVIFAGLYAATIPVWHDPEMTIMVAVASLGLAGVMAARWSKSETPRRIVTWLMLAAVLYSTTALAFPGVLNALGSLGSGAALVVTDVVDDVVDAYGDHKAVEDIEEMAETNAQTRDNGLYKRLIGERQAIRDRAVANGGTYASDADRKRDLEIGERLAAIRSGVFWEQQMKESETASSSAKPEKAASEKTAPKKGAAAPGSSGKAASPSVEKKTARSGAHRHRYTEADLDYIFAPLRQ